MNIASLLQGGMGAMLLDNVTKKMGIENKQARLAISMGLPILITALSRNAQKKEGASGIMNAITNKHDGGILDNISGLFEGDKEEHEDGSKILGHIFGDRKDSVSQSISKKSGLSTQKVVGVLSTLAPIVMGLIGKNAKSQNANSDGLSSIIGGLLGGIQQEQDNGIMGLLDNIIDGNDDDDDDNKGLGENLMGMLFGS